jgi:ATP-binding cassette subfamily B protein
MFRFYRPHLIWAFWLLVLIVVGNVCLILTQHWVGKALDAVRQGVDPVAAAWPWVFLLCGLALTRALLGAGVAVAGSIVGQRVASDLRRTIFAQVLTLDLRWHRAHPPGEIITRSNRDADRIREALVGGMRTSIDLGLSLVCLTGLLWWYHWKLAIIPLISILLAFAWLWMTAGTLVARGRELGEAADDVAQDIGEAVVGIRVVKAFALEERRLERFRLFLETHRTRAMALLRISSLRLPIAMLMVALGHVVVLFWGALMVQDHTITVGALVAALLAVTGLVFRMDGVGRLLRMFSDARSSAQRVDELQSAHPAILSGTAPVPDGPLGIRFRGVAASAQVSGHLIVQDISFDIPAGSMLTLVGPTGSGKTTIALMTSRLVDPSQGEICLLSGNTAYPLKNLSLDALRQSVQLVFQDAVCFGTSIRDNLCLCRFEATDEEIWAALEVVQLAERLHQRPEGLDVILGERGLSLSGGERQRLVLARALLGKPRILVLDDATSALDTVTERSVLAALRAQGLTILIVGSRLPLMMLADRVALLVQGRIKACDSHARLLETNPAYRKLLGASDGP